MTGDDELVERMAEAIFNASGTARLQSWERYRAFYRERGLLSPDYYAQARAALAVAEPVIRDRAIAATGRKVMADARMGSWMSAAMDDPSVCAEMRADIEEWFSAGSYFSTGATP